MSDIAAVEVLVSPAWVVAPEVETDPEIVAAVSNAKAEFDKWVGHYLSEKKPDKTPKWPMKSILIWSVGQTLHPSNNRKYHLIENTEVAKRQEIAEGIINYLSQEAGAGEGVDKWTKDRKQEKEMGWMDPRSKELYEASKKLLSDTPKH